MSINFIVRGQVRTAQEVETILTQPKKKIARDRPQTHHGFLVHGYPPGHVIDAEKAHAKATAEWKTHTREMRDRALSEGKREPKPWDEAVWSKKHKRHRIAKPFETPEAAEIAKSMVAKEGWTHLEIIEVKRGKQTVEQQAQQQQGI